MALGFSTYRNSIGCVERTHDFCESCWELADVEDLARCDECGDPMHQRLGTCCFDWGCSRDPFPFVICKPCADQFTARAKEAR